VKLVLIDDTSALSFVGMALDQRGIGAPVFAKTTDKPLESQKAKRSWRSQGDSNLQPTETIRFSSQGHAGPGPKSFKGSPQLARQHLRARERTEIFINCVRLSSDQSWLA
jgi:hypothetical protein